MSQSQTQYQFLVSHKRRKGTDFSDDFPELQTQFTHNEKLSLLLQQILTQMKPICNIRQIITYLQVVSLWMLIASLPFRIGRGEGAFPRIAMILAGVLFVLEYIVNKRWNEWHWSRDKRLYVVMICYYLFIFIWQLFSSTLTSRFSWALEQRLPFALCGIIGLLGFNQQVKLRHVGYVFLLSSLCTSIYIILQGNGFSFFFLSWKEQSFLFSGERIRLVNSHMVYNLYLNVSLIFAFYILNLQDVSKGIKIVVSIIFLWILYILCLTEGRVGQATSILIISVVLLSLTYKYAKKALIFTVIICGIIGYVILTQNNRFDAHKITHDPRSHIWGTALETAKETPILGWGVCDARDKFVCKAFNNPHLTEFWIPFIENYNNGDKQKIHIHNSYIEAWTEFGIIGILTLLFIFLYPLIVCPKQNRIYVFMIVGSFMLQCFFDAFLIPMLYCLSIILFTSRNAISEESVAQKHAEE